MRSANAVFWQAIARELARRGENVAAARAFERQPVPGKIEREALLTQVRRSAAAHLPWRGRAARRVARDLSVQVRCEAYPKLE